MNARIVRVNSPIGKISLGASRDGLCALEFDMDPDRLEERLVKRFGGAIARDESISMARYEDALAAYFNGDLHAIDSILADTGGTSFQRKVWARLRRIPAGRTLGYGEMARDLGIPGGARAVGLANGSNPVAIVIPCHRVIAADGKLGGYGGGLDRKRWLLSHEGAMVSDLSFPGPARL